MSLGIQQISAAYDRISPFIHKTPLIRSKEIDKLCGCEIIFKADNFQKVGAFKARGACNAIMSMEEERLRCGVITHSSGNHGAALAWAAAMKKTDCIVVMPKNASAVKIDAVNCYGGRVLFCEPTMCARETMVQDFVSKQSSQFIHPFDDYSVIAGQGTIAIEFASQLDGLLDKILVPVGGGGLISGISVFVKDKGGLASQVIGTEPEKARDAADSFYSGIHVKKYEPKTMADGLRATLGVKNFEIVSKNVDDFALASEAQIVEATKLIWSRLKVLVEPSAAVPLAAILNNPNYFRGQRIGIILSGGNIDLDNLPW